MAPRNVGIYTITVGDFEVTALNDGMFQAATELLVGVEGAEAERLLRETFRVLPPRISVSAFLLRAGGRTVLLDAGTGVQMGVGVLGDVHVHLHALGIAPEAIDAVLMTHLHIDHAGGLIDGEGRARFPRAEIVIHEREHGFWLVEGPPSNADERTLGAFDLARRTTGPYRERLRTAAGGEVLPGVTIEHLPGHTPGHSGYFLRSGGESLLIWGDVVHIPAVQLARPAASMAIDVDGEVARTTRERVLDHTASERILVAGMHLDFPTFGHVTRAGGGYAFVPVVWEP
ncbi:MAG TPA: MBL fold metallo-hydrolase [Acetobacteraceae bacterium]|jgi:glyoxylase-like metal-dependent hydrolase (beta-lactamase superfamily II)|nr:MBL fold metallo-hydrolase [Acetobacteraceae bacterium]